MVLFQNSVHFLHHSICRDGSRYQEVLKIRVCLPRVIPKRYLVCLFRVLTDSSRNNQTIFVNKDKGV